jgi:hypothetical protein
MKTRNGKIARLPNPVREELNLRMERSEPSPQLLAWLNALPEVREFVQREFGGKPVSKHNLSQWRRGGFQDWLTRREFFADARNADFSTPEPQEGPGKLVADQAATILAGRYAGLLVRWNGECTRDFETRARVLNGLCRGVAELQREAHKANRDNLALETLPDKHDGEHSSQTPSQSVAVSSSDKLVGLVGPAAVVPFPGTKLSRLVHEGKPSVCSPSPPHTCGGEGGERRSATQSSGPS